MKAALVIMAAGMGSRYGGEKQTDGIGPHGEAIMEYSVYDAVRAGFHKIVFIIKPGMEPTIRALCGDRIQTMRTPQGEPVEVAYAEQDFSSVPGFYTIPKGRTKPFGTVHAALCARDRSRGGASRFARTRRRASDLPDAALAEQPVEPLLHPAAAEGGVDDRIAAAHVGNLPERLAETGARNADLFGFIRRPDEFQAAAHLVERNDLPADAFAQFGPRLFEPRELVAQPLPVDIFVAGLLQAAGHEFGIVIENPANVRLGLLP